MNLGLLRLMQKHVAEQCRFALDGLKGPGDTWLGIQVFLTCTANVAKLLWGQGGTKSKQRQPLRESLGVKEDSPLKATTMRNHFEHLDERLERWDAESKSHNYADRNFIPTGDPGFAPIDMFRNLDQATGVLSFWGDQFSLSEIVRAVAELLPIAEAESKKPRHEPPSSASAAGGGQ